MPEGSGLAAQQKTAEEFPLPAKAYGYLLDAQDGNRGKAYATCRSDQI